VSCPRSRPASRALALCRARASPPGRAPVCRIGYIWVLKDKHWLTSAPYWTPFFVSYSAAVGCAWVLYAALHAYDIFTTCFTLQVCPVPVRRLLARRAVAAAGSGARSV